MVYRLFIALLFPISLLAQPYYISPTGDDATGDGSFANPWFSIGYADNACSAGDTVFCRGGTYNYNTTQNISVSGTAGNEIVFINYPNESPVFDFWTYDMTGFAAGHNTDGVSGVSVGYIKFEGLHIRRLWNINTDNGRGRAWYFNASNHITYNQCKVDSIAGYGFGSHNTNDVFYYNCDAWWCADPQDEDPGNAGMGFINTGTVNESMEDTILYQGCRSWYCADQGWGGTAGYYVIFDSCWVFGNGLHEYGFTQADQHGFKPGYTHFDVDSIAVLMRNCLSVFNGGQGVNDNTGDLRYNYRFYNNTVYANGSDGFMAYSSTLQTDNIKRLQNNISFDNGRYDLYDLDNTDHSYNSWDAPYIEGNEGVTGDGKYLISPSTVNTDDFKALPIDKADAVAILAAPRKADGSLPDIGDYFKLAEGSDLIDKGVVLTYPDGTTTPYNGEAPDLGAFESGDTPVDPPAPTSRNPISYGGKRLFYNAKYLK